MKCYITGIECDYKDGGEQSQEIFLFIICPFTMPYNGFYDSVNGFVSKMLKEKKVVKNVERADQALQLGFIICRRICSKILQANYILADVSLPNANVYYELGLSFGFGKEIIICARQDIYNQYIEFITNSAPPKAVIRYLSLKDLLVPSKYETAFEEALSIDPNILIPSNTKIVEYHNNPKILLIVNPKSPVQGFYEKALKDVIKDLGDLNKEFRIELGKNKIEIEERLKNDDIPDNEKIKLREQIEIIDQNIVYHNLPYDRLRIDRIQVDASLDLNLLAEKIRQAEICIIDTTQYDNEINGIIYFSLGLAQALERAVIPITNTGFTDQIPFDIRGLWQIDFSSIFELRDGFKEIFPAILLEFEKKKEEFPYRQFWNKFAKDTRSIKIQNCCRNVGEEFLNKARTVIDNWDYLTVSELSVFLTQKYPKAMVQILPTTIKKEHLNFEDKAILKKELSDASSFIFLGSSDANDYTEFFLSEIYGLNQSTHQKYEKDFFIFYKKHLKTTHIAEKSSQFEESKTPILFCKISDRDYEYIKWKDREFRCSEIYDAAGINGTTYGVLTIARNPFTPNKWILALSGFTGIATYGLIKLIIDTEINEKKQEKYKKQYELLMEVYHKYPNTNLNVLVEIKYKIPKGKTEESDNRILRNLSFVDIQPV